MLLDVSIELRAGRSTGLVGGSGSGKSTVVRLLQRLYDPGLGRVELDGVDLAQLDVRWLRSHLALVAQEPVLYNTTVMQNVKCAPSCWCQPPKDRESRRRPLCYYY